MTGRRRWQPPDPVIGPHDPPHRDDPSPLARSLDRLLDGLGAPPADALGTLFDQWHVLAGQPLADHGVPRSIDDGVLVVAVDDPLWATEWRYRQGAVLRRCDEVLGTGVVARIDVRVQPRKGR